jgi:benzylsuccinate CoA-transferase BbsF subunit
MARGALGDIRVVDFSWVVAGPMMTKMMAAMGAEVIKIESSLRSEYTNRGHMFPAINNSKRSVAINLTTAEGQDLIRRLVAISDVIVENFSGGVLAKYGLDYESLRKVKPDIVFVSASGMGRIGPQKDLLAYGTLLQAYSGRAALIGPPNPRLERMGILPAWTDPATAYWELLATLSALFHRARTGAGAHVDQSMLESTVSILPASLLREALHDALPIPTGNDEIEAAPSGCFMAAGEDEWLALSVRSDAEWQAFCAAIGRADLLEDTRLATRDGRLADKPALDAAAADWIARYDPRDAERILLAAGIFAARSRNVVDLLDDPVLRRRGLFPWLPSGIRTIALPWTEEGGWRGDMRDSPALGADNDYVLRELLGIDAERVKELVNLKVVC